MKHKRIENLIQKALDREISKNEEKALHAHLAQCSGCRQFHEQMMQTEGALSTLVEIFPRHDFNDRVLAKLGSRRAFSWRKIVPAGAAAWVASLVVLALLPWPQALVRKVATSVPGIVRFFDNAGVVITSLSNVLLPLAKSTLDVQYAIFGLVTMILSLFVFSRLVKKEAQCKL
jgi:anti-sigma factor RsiW